jgi:hypothetical protein
MENMFKINGNPEEFADLGVFHKLSKQFLPYAQEKLGFNKPVGINLISDPQNAKNPLGKTAYYNPGNMEVTVFVDNRHIKDILRSMSHELVHHTQNCRGEFDGGIDTGPGYAQEDGHMRKMEEEAYLEGQMLLRDFEDTIKKENKQMSKLNEEKGSLERLMISAAQDAEARGASQQEIGQIMYDLMVKAGVNLDPGRNLLDPETSDPDAMDVQKQVDKIQMKKGDEKLAAAMADLENTSQIAASDGKPALEEELGDGKTQGTDSVEAGLDNNSEFTQGDLAAEMGGKRGKEEKKEEPLEEGDGAICEECGGNGLHEKHCNTHRKNESLEEGWSNKKDQLLFERLVNKWIK